MEKDKRMRFAYRGCVDVLGGGRIFVVVVVVVANWVVVFYGFRSQSWDLTDPPTLFPLPFPPRWTSLLSCFKFKKSKKVKGE